VWFDAGDGRQLLAELNLRCEAGWRYSAADQEEPGRELQALRVRERRRHEEADRRLAAAAQRFNAQLGIGEA
ncbi:Uncharacterized protein SCF082_LOCUS4647, partial [Durusdinium trenchii]